MTVGEQLRAATARLAGAGVPEARLQAELLLADLLAVDRGGLFVRRGEKLDVDQAETFQRRVLRRESREPLQHIIGCQEFHGLAFRVDRRALVPRPETEGLVDAALALDLPRRARVVDLGTGCGCLAITLAVKRPDLCLHALDRSPDALDVARANAARHRVEHRVEFERGEIAAPPEDWSGQMDLVLSNPPYVAAGEWTLLDPEVRDHDPREALVAGPTGLEVHRLVLTAAWELLRPQGHLALEIGYGQGEQVRAMACAAGFRGVEIRPDFQGIPRVLVAERPPRGR